MFLHSSGDSPFGPFPFAHSPKEEAEGVEDLRLFVQEATQQFKKSPVRQGNPDRFMGIFDRISEFVRADYILFAFRLHSCGIVIGDEGVMVVIPQTLADFLNGCKRFILHRHGKQFRQIRTVPLPHRQSSGGIPSPNFESNHHIFARGPTR
jgi:hypothetical protein